MVKQQIQETVNKKTVTGVIVSVKNQKTVIVSVTTMTRHPLYNKAIKKTTRFAAHNDHENVKLGDTITMTETKPISKTKHFRIVSSITP